MRRPSTQSPLEQPSTTANSSTANATQTRTRRPTRSSAGGGLTQLSSTSRARPLILHEQRWVREQGTVFVDATHEQRHTRRSAATDGVAHVIAPTARGESIATSSRASL